MAMPVYYKKFEKETWPKIKKGLLKNLSEEEVDAIHYSFRVGAITPEVADFVHDVDPKILNDMGGKAKDLKLFDLAMYYFDLAKNWEGLVKLCIHVLKNKIGTDVFFALSELNRALDSSYKFSMAETKALKEIYNNLSEKKKEEKTIKEPLGIFIERAFEA
ncbi:MAG: hypothetical protein R6U26_00500 [Candidatus Undinarchaeales archaeon]